MQPDNPCRGRWDDGRPCANRARKDAIFCAMHAGRPVTETCCHRHPDGRRCRGIPGFGSLFCFHHDTSWRE